MYIKLVPVTLVHSERPKLYTRVATYHPPQNSLIFPWYFTVFYALWQIKKIIFLLYFNFNGAKFGGNF